MAKWVTQSSDTKLELLLPWMELLLCSKFHAPNSQLINHRQLQQHTIIEKDKASQHWNECPLSYYCTQQYQCKVHSKILWPCLSPPAEPKMSIALLAFLTSPTSTSTGAWSPSKNSSWVRCIIHIDKRSFMTRMNGLPGIKRQPTTGWHSCQTDIYKNVERI